MRVLFLTTMMPGLRRTGSEVASQAFVDALRAAGHSTTVMAYKRIGTDPPIADDDIAVADRHIETSFAGAWPVGWMLRAVLTRRPYSVAKYVTAAYRRALAKELGTHAPDLVVLDHAQMGWLLSPRLHGAPLVYLAHNVEHRVHGQLATRPGLRSLMHRREAARLLPIERRLVDIGEEVWTLTSDDASGIAAMDPSARCRSFDVPPTRVPSGAEATSCDVALLGGWHWTSNAIGLEWFVDEVAPHLEGCGLDVIVGGLGGPEIVRGRCGLRAVGRVPDALEFLQSARVVVVPSVAGGGVQVKTLDAIASGRRVVVTTIGMRGIVSPPATVRVADDPARFAQAIEESVRDEAAAGDVDAGRQWASARTQAFVDAVRTAVEEIAPGAA